MLADMVITSPFLLMISGRDALRFWPEHIPVLFFRYAGQGVLAGLAATAFGVGGIEVLVAMLAAVLVGQMLHREHRAATRVLDSTVDALAAAIDARDSYTAGPSRRVADYAARIAVAAGWSKAMVERTRRAGLLHDVGKLGVADRVLLKPGSLDAEEYAHIQRHAAVGQTSVERVEGLAGIASIVGQHHERWDGAGYPRQIAARAIRPEARLVAIADVYDALTTDRPYRAALPEDEVLAHLDREAGRQLDPDLTRMFLSAVHAGRTAGVMFCYCATH
jgi:HD-GYP domain-containing protein (c-di-GMP phosphodiesterase class II)